MEVINIAIMAHVDAGKTSITEAILFKLGLIKELGNVNHGSTQTDSMEEERARGITIKSTPIEFILNGKKFNLIDTPGHPDFISEVKNSLAVIDVAILVISAISGIEAQTRMLISELKKKNIPTIIFINKIDMLVDEDISLFEELKEVYPDTLLYCPHESLPKNKEIIIDFISLKSEQLLTRYYDTFMDNNYTYLDDMIQLLMEGNLSLVLKGSAKKLTGIKLLLDVLGNIKSEKENIEGGYVFKIDVLPSKKNIIYFYNKGSDMKTIEFKELILKKYSVKCNKIYDLSGRSLDEIYSNDIFIIYDDTLSLYASYGKAEIKNTFLEYNIPLFEYIITSKSHQHRILDLLRRISKEDQGMEVTYEMSQIRVKCHGEIYIEILQSRLLREYNIEIDYGTIPNYYIESIEGSASKTIRINDFDNPVKAGVTINIEPQGDHEQDNVVFLNAEKGIMKKSFFNAIEEGISESLIEGLFGWRVMGCKINVDFVEFKSPVTTTHDFKIVSSLAVAECVKQSKPIILQMYVVLDVLVPSNKLSQIISFLTENSIIDYEVSDNNNIITVNFILSRERLSEVKSDIDRASQGEAIVIPKSYFYQKSNLKVYNTKRSVNHPFDAKSYLSFNVYKNLGIKNYKDF